MTKGKAIRRYATRLKKAGKAKKNGVLHCCHFDFGSKGPHTDKRAKRVREPVTE